MQDTVMNETATREALANGQAPVQGRFDFRSSEAARRANLAALADKARTVDPATAASMRKIAGKWEGTLLPGIRDAMTGVGLGTEDAADAYAAYRISAWQAANGRTDDRSPATYRAVRAQTAAALSATPSLDGATDAAMQEIRDGMLVRMLMIEIAVDQAGVIPPACARSGTPCGRARGAWASICGR